MHHWIDRPDALDAWLAARADATVIGLDTEFLRTNTFRPRLALVQLDIGGDVALLDAPRLGAMPALAARLADAACVCVMHGAGEDLEALAGVLPRGPATLFDTQLAAAFAGVGFGLSYQRLVAAVLGIELPKSETRSDWLARPLSAAQLDYAAQDVAHLPELHARLAQRLAELGRSAWLAEDCRRLVARVCEAQPDPQPQRALRAAARFAPEQQARLRRVLRWRDTKARVLDKPRPWILDDARALNLVADPPQDEDELAERCRGLRALRGALRQELFAVLHAPLAADERDVMPIPAPLTGAQLTKLAALRNEVAAIAARLALPESLLCPRRHLETLVAEGRWPAALEGWRKELLYEVLMGAEG